MEFTDESNVRSRSAESHKCVFRFYPILGKFRYNKMDQKLNMGYTIGSRFRALRLLALSLSLAVERDLTQPRAHAQALYNAT